ncbi:hypothetical protein ACPOL_2468 [Acidisarcina polymorpha]|uniref:Uncharacterized protein n=1 Tax=Acidisarcina polymorpha TaxID=2211140 RepID=A0A2Z5FYK6_9BACT|nr:hypothetical protein ACPOL_2468 [Acidisarcina polymorpha]
MLDGSKAPAHPGAQGKHSPEFHFRANSPKILATSTKRE